ncbi:MAG TPA: hypothetical protein VL614_15000 [Acetobacteraceae bacterium]|jgi:hypothetical protein|nr:hypothetical protein [Acetobacteraceae bacterium]
MGSVEFQTTKDIERAMLATNTKRASRRFCLRAETKISAALGAIQWLELFMMQGIRNKDWNTGVAAHWLINNPHPMFYQVKRTYDGQVEIACNPNMVGTKLRIGRAPPRPPVVSDAAVTYYGGAAGGTISTAV